MKFRCVVFSLTGYGASRPGGRKEALRHPGVKRRSRDHPGTPRWPLPLCAFARCACSGGTGEGLSPTHTRDTMPPFIKEQSVFAAPPQ